MGVVIQGDLSRLKKTLAKLSEPDFKKLNKAVGEILRTSTLERFDKGKDSDGNTWDKSDRAKSTGGKTLLHTSRLRNSIKTHEDKKGIVLGTNTIYAATHQFGDKNRIIKAKDAKTLAFKTPNGYRRKKVVKVTIKPRPFLGISEDDIGEIKATVMDMLKGVSE